MTTQTQHSQDGAGPMPSWLRERYAGVIEQQRRSVEQEAARTGKAAGVVADQRNLVSFSVVFGICNNLGGRSGAALRGTFQTAREPDISRTS